MRRCRARASGAARASCTPHAAQGDRDHAVKGLGRLVRGIGQREARHDVRFHISGVKRYHHRDVGDLELNYERLDLVFDSGLTIITYTADRGTRSAEALALLGSLAATAAAADASSALTQLGM